MSDLEATGSDLQRRMGWLEPSPRGSDAAIARLATSPCDPKTAPRDLSTTTRELTSAMCDLTSTMSHLDLALGDLERTHRGLAKPFDRLSPSCGRSGERGARPIATLRHLAATVRRLICACRRLEAAACSFASMFGDLVAASGHLRGRYSVLASGSRHLASASRDLGMHLSEPGARSRDLGTRVRVPQLQHEHIASSTYNPTAEREMIERQFRHAVKRWSSSERALNHFDVGGGIDIGGMHTSKSADRSSSSRGGVADFVFESPEFGVESPDFAIERPDFGYMSRGEPSQSGDVASQSPD